MSARILTIAAACLATTAMSVTAAPAITLIAAPAPADVDPLRIVDQELELAAQDTFDVTLALPPSITPTLGSPDAAATPGRVVLRVTAFAALTDRRDVEKIRGSRTVATARGVEDTFDVDLSVAAADPHVVGRPAADQVAIAVAVEAADSAVGLQLPREGVYPIGLELRVDGSLVGEARTFIHRRSAGESTIGDLPVGILMAQTAAASVSADGSLALSDAEVADMNALTESMEAMDAAATAADPAAPTIPRAALVEPATLQALQELQPELAARLIAVLARSEVLAAPKLPLDPSGVVAVDRDRIYTEWLRAGESIVSGLVPGIRTDRSLYIADGAVTDAAVTYLAGAGVDGIVMSPELYDSTPGSIQDYGDPTWLQTIQLSDGSTVPALRIDPSVGARLQAIPGDPAQAAVDLVAEVLTYRQYLDAIGRTVPRSGLLLAGSDAGAFDAAFAAELARRLLQVDGVDLVSPADLVATMDSQLVDGTLGTLTLPQEAGPDMTARFRTIDEVTFESAAIGTMLPTGDGHLAQWRALIDTMPSTGLTDAEVEEMATGLQARFDQFRHGVRGPQPFSFTLTGRTGTIRFRIQNTTDVPLTVMVRLDGAKLTFPVNDVRYTIDPQGQRTVEAVAESRSNGTSQVIVRILTPSGAQIVPDVALTAKVRAFTGLGQLITGAGLLVLVTWWGRHWRLNRRRNAAAATSDRHPAVRGRRRRPHIADPDDPADPADPVDPAHAAATGAAEEALPADAGATSLPPS